ncbi:MAG: RNA polymerase sigma-70 factor [Tannerellaceae bacterium]|nr:RNA polymerase sigma-70 factor [Tannerellaceae bacterium]
MFVIVQQIREGNEQAFERLFRQYYPQLCIFAASITGRMDVAEEIVQEVFYVCWRDREQLHITHSIKSYLYGSVRNRALHHWEHLQVVERHRDYASDLLLESPSPHDIMEYKELEYLLRCTLRKLPPRRLQIFRMHRLEGLKYAEIAARLSISVKTVEAEMTKALKALRKEIELYIKQS